MAVRQERLSGQQDALLQLPLLQLQSRLCACTRLQPAELAVACCCCDAGCLLPADSRRSACWDTCHA
jgi:hypothetical protein